MELSMDLSYVEKGQAASVGRQLDTAAKLCADAGFRFVDYTSNYKLQDYIGIAYRDREILDRYGITVEQCHAPFNRYGIYASQEEFMRLFKASFDCAKILGAKYIVIHADELQPTGNKWDIEELISRNYEYLAPYGEYCRKNGIVMAIENLFEDMSPLIPFIEGKNRFSSRIDEQIGLIDRFNDSAVAACWDFGHACCSFGRDEMTEKLRMLGNRLVCTHVHDNNYRQDMHLIPFLGEIDWKAQMTVLKEINYNGKLSFEFVYGHIPDNIVKSYLNYVSYVGNELMGMLV